MEGGCNSLVLQDLLVRSLKEMVSTSVDMEHTNSYVNEDFDEVCSRTHLSMHAFTLESIFKD